jgi:hypothetical protein
MTELTDNRYRLEVDVKKLELWEVAVFESEKISDIMLLLARYLANGNGRISPDLPAEPIDELPRAEIARIKNSEAYKVVRRFNQAQLEQVTTSVKAGAGF